MVASVCTIFGRILPILFMFGLACLFIYQGNHSNVAFTWNTFVPDLTDTGKLSFIVGAFLTFAGIEASASNAASAKNPRRNYPIAIITSAGIALVLVTLIALAIAIVLPKDNINLDAGIMQAIHAMFKQEGLLWLFPVSGLIIALGMLGEINNWIPAPTRGLLVAGRDGVLSKYWQRENKHAVHWRILVYQAVLFTTISTMYLFMKNVQDAFWLMNVVPAMLYIIMYILMFASGVKLRYSHPEVPRRYRVPFGNLGIWSLAALGALAGLIAIGFAFIPPEQVKREAAFSYVTVVTVGFIVFSALPFVIYTLRRPEWRTVVDESVPE
jgi:amino acid transporter